MKYKELLKKICKVIFVFMLFNYGWLFQLIPIKVFGITSLKPGGKSSVALSFFSSITLAIIFIIMYRKELVTEFKKFKNNFGDCFDKGVKCWFFGLMAMIISNVIIQKIFHSSGSANEDAVQAMISVLPLVMLLNAGFVAPFVEEIVFRKSIRDIFKNKWLFSCISGLLFGIVHITGTNPEIVDYLYILPYGSLGIAFAISYYETDTIFTPVMFHMIHNIVLIIMSII